MEIKKYSNEQLLEILQSNAEKYMQQDSLTREEILHHKEIIDELNKRVVLELAKNAHTKIPNTNKIQIEHILAPMYGMDGSQVIEKALTEEIMFLLFRLPINIMEVLEWEEQLKKYLKFTIGQELNETLVNTVKNIIERILRKIEKKHNLLILNRFQVHIPIEENLTIKLVPKRIIHK